MRRFSGESTFKTDSTGFDVLFDPRFYVFLQQLGFQFSKHQSPQVTMGQMIQFNLNANELRLSSVSVFFELIGVDEPQGIVVRVVENRLEERIVVGHVFPYLVPRLQNWRTVANRMKSRFRSWWNELVLPVFNRNAGRNDKTGGNCTSKRNVFLTWCWLFQFRTPTV